METAFKNIVIKNGLFLGFSLALYEFIKYSAGILYTSNTGLSILLWIGSIGLYVYFINWGVNQYKNANNGQVTIADGLKIGALSELLLEYCWVSTISSTPLLLLPITTNK